jgi:hypothetical protein
LRTLLKGAAMVNWDRLLAEAKTFFSSGLFFMLLGGLIMYFGYRLSNDPFTHSAFVFLVVILGLALFLFGTGTSASGEGTSGQVKVAIAGGAGVLAMVLGFGVAHWREDLTDVFKRQRDYGVLELSIGEATNSIPVDLNNFEAQASSGEMPLPLWKDKQRIEILVPIPPGSEKESSVTVELTPKPNFQGSTVSVDTPLKLEWKKKDAVERRIGFNNEILEVINKPLKQAKTAPSTPAQPLVPGRAGPQFNPQ